MHQRVLLPFLRLLYSKIHRHADLTVSGLKQQGKCKLVLYFSNTHVMAWVMSLLVFLLKIHLTDKPQDSIESSAFQEPSEDASSLSRKYPEFFCSTVWNQTTQIPMKCECSREQKLKNDKQHLLDFEIGFRVDWAEIQNRTQTPGYL